MKKQTLIWTILTTLTGTVLSLGTAFGQTYVPDSSRQYASDELRYQNELTTYQRSYTNAMDQYNRCMQQQRNSGNGNQYNCQSYMNQANYYRNLITSMRRPVAQYPGQGMFPGPGQVAQGVANGLMNGQTQFPTDPSQTLQQPPVDYRSAMGGYANQGNTGMQGQLPNGGFQQYSNGGGYQTIRVPPPARPQTPIYRQPVQAPRTQPVYQQRPQVLVYPPYQGYPGVNPPQ